MRFTRYLVVLDSECIVLATTNKSKQVLCTTSVILYSLE